MSRELLRQALDALKYHRDQTRPIHLTQLAIHAIEDRLAQQDAMASEGCLLNMPPDDFYKATIREAVAFWNDYARALMAIQRANRWRRHSALRDTKGASDANQA